MGATLNVTKRELEAVKKQLTITKQDRITTTTSIPTVSNIGDDELKFVLEGGVLYLYRKVNGELYRVEFTKV